jgi:ABC-type multidrug transport system permease subunit
VPASIRRIVAIARKEFLHIVRDWRMIVTVLVMPLFQLLLFAYAISFDVRNVPAVVLDQDNTVASRGYVQAMGRSGFFRIVGAVPDLSGVDRAFNRSVARVAVVIAPGYEDAIASGGKGRAAVLVDGSEPNSAQLGQAYAVALNNVWSRQILVSWAEARGTSFSGVGQLEPRVRDWYNPDRRSAEFLIPGLMVVIIMIVTVQQTAVTLVREREFGTLEQMLESPLRHSELILGKVLPWALLGFVDTLGITAVSLLVFQVPLRGDVAVLAVGMFLFILCSLSIGLVISAMAPSIESANLIALLISFLPGFMLSGLAWPLGSIPVWLQVVSCLFPARFMVEIARGVFLRGTSWNVLGIQVVWLVIYAAVGLGLSAILNRRQEQA